MFSNISWQDYFLTVMISLVVYYGYVLLLYFRKDISNLSTSEIVSESYSNDQATVNRQFSKQEEQNALLFSTVYDMMEELKEVIQTAAEKKFPKEELLNGLKARIKKYKKIKGTAFQVSVNNHIRKECEEKCSILLKENELKNLW